MTIEHHISDELLMDYASGALEEGWSIAVATHLALCPKCRARLAVMESTGGALLEKITCEPDVASDKTSWSALQAKLSTSADPKTPSTNSTPTMRTPAGSSSLPEPLRSYLGGDIDQLRWRALGLGAYHYPIKTHGDTISVRLLRIPAGKPVPEHSHNGRELTLVLKGAFRDGEDIFGPGDFEETDEAVNHQPVAEPGEDCICLAVTDAPLKFRSRLVRLIQPLIGI
jgi:putative transcriptional regulator